MDSSDNPKLNTEQIRLAKKAAGRIIPIPPPKWEDTGDDTRVEWLGLLIKELQATKNTSIANIIEHDNKKGYKMLQEKIKSMRQRERDKSMFMSLP